MKAGFAIVLLLLAMLCASAMAQEDTAEDWFNRGQELFRNHSYEEANEAYNNALALNPQYGMAWGGKATALSLTGRYNESLDAYDKAIETWPANDTERISELWVFKGNTLQLTGRTKEAFKAFDEAIQIYPQNFDAWIWKGESLRNQGLYNESLNAYGMAVKAAPAEIPAAVASAKVAKADVLLKMGRYEEAYDIYNETSDPNSTENIDKFYSSWSWRGMGGALAGLGLYDESLQAFNKSIEVYPKGAFQTWGDEGDALSDMEKYEEAVAAYDRSIELAPSEFVSARAEIGKGKALDKVGRHEEAIKAYEDAVDNLDKTLQQSAFDAQSWYLKGTALKALGRQAEADESYARAKELGYEG
jgi:tetratricopeptide (TPR) repeat protein